MATARVRVLGRAGQRWGTIDALRKPWGDHQMPKGMPLVAHG